VSILQSFIKLTVSKNFYWKFFTRLIESLDMVYTVPVGKKNVRFHCGGELAHYRAETLLTKEPYMIEWINGFKPDDVFLDIGANIGAYSIYASVIKGVRVISIEPSTENHASLCRNIRENNVGHLVYPFCVAANDCEETKTLYMHSGGLKPGGSGAIFGTEQLTDDQPIETEGTQYSVGFSMDGLIETFDLPFPTKLKMDVIGTQGKVIKGAQGLLNDSRIRSIFLEIMTPFNKDQSESIFKEVERAGFTLDKQVSSIEYFFSKPPLN
jgi:FkbM family methyltransferase